MKEQIWWLDAEEIPGLHAGRPDHRRWAGIRIIVSQANPDHIPTSELPCFDGNGAWIKASSYEEALSWARRELCY